RQRRAARRRRGPRHPGGRPQRLRAQRRRRRGGPRRARGAGRRRHPRGLGHRGAALARRGVPALHRPPLQPDQGRGPSHDPPAAADRGDQLMTAFDYPERTVATPSSTLLPHTWYLTGRKLHALVRQPWVLAFSVIQPAIWLFLFGELFRTVIDIPGFAYGGSYLAYLVPGIVAMNAMSANMW